MNPASFSNLLLKRYSGASLRGSALVCGLRKIICTPARLALLDGILTTNIGLLKPLHRAS
jgi:hypothetical protein